jgi:hypothetical protein
MRLAKSLKRVHEYCVLLTCNAINGDHLSWPLVSRVKFESDSNNTQVILDINTDIYKISIGEKYAIALVCIMSFTFGILLSPDLWMSVPRSRQLI